MSKAIGELSSSIDGFFGVDGLTQDTLDLAVLGASAGVSVAAVEQALTKIKWNGQSLSSKLGNWEGPAVAALGLAGGLALGRYASPSIGAGWGAGLIGLALAKLIGHTVDWAMAGEKRGKITDTNLLRVFSGVPTGGYAGLGNQRPEQVLLGPGAAALESIRTEVRTKQGVGVSGMGETNAGNVVVKNKPTFPNGFEGLRRSGLV